MTGKTSQLQIRVTPAEKAALKRLARSAGEDLSAYVLSRVLPESGTVFRELVAALAAGADRRFVLAELNDALTAFAGGELVSAVAMVPAEFRMLTGLEQNYIAAMVEQAAHDRGVAPPSWLREVPPLEEPHFATALRSLRLYLLGAAPVAYKRRNIFIDAGLGARV